MSAPDGLGSTEEFAPAAKPKQRFPLHLWADLSSLPKRSPIIKSLLDKSALSVIFGASGSCKTFVAIDIAAAIARGVPWRGRRVTQGAVVYLAAEGGIGIEERFTAYARHHDIDPVGIPLYVMPNPIDMCASNHDTDELIAGIKAATASDVVLVVVDTLSRVMAGGNENAPDDMGSFVTNCDRIRAGLQAHVAVIHHTGKDQDRGARGHSLLRAAADTEIEVTRDEVFGSVTAAVTKQRDHKTGDTFAWRLETVELGKDEDDEPVNSCVIVPADADPAMPKRKAAKLPNGAKVALGHLRAVIALGGEVPPASNYIPHHHPAVPEAAWRRKCYDGSISEGDSESAKRKAFARAATALQGAGIIGIANGWVWIA